MTKRALVFLASGAEEMETIIAVDTLRRAGVEVTLTGTEGDKLEYECSRHVTVKADETLKTTVDRKIDWDVVVIPGGAGGAKRLCDNLDVGAVIKEQVGKNGLVAAICAGPTVLKAHGIFNNADYALTSHPSVEAVLSDEYKYLQDRVVHSKNLITSRGPGTAIEWALKIAEVLEGKEKAQAVAGPMVVLKEQIPA
eukprot:Clim_evm3s96 gene=Clim_evmTU3s96